MLFEVSEKGFVREVLQAGRIIRHAIARSGKVEARVTVSVVPLVVTSVVAQEGCWAVCRYGALVYASHCGGVVGASHNSSIAHIVMVSYERDLAQISAMF